MTQHLKTPPATTYKRPSGQRMRKPLGSGSSCANSCTGLPHCASRPSPERRLALASTVRMVMTCTTLLERGPPSELAQMIAPASPRTSSIHARHSQTDIKTSSKLSLQHRRRR
eukprot:360202-Chlamydomonas_euryale.AAC.11